MADHPDNEVLKKYIMLGLLLGGGAAIAPTVVRTSRLNKKLKDSMSPEPKRDEHTLLVTQKAASVPAAYKYTALLGSGLVSYAALTALFNKLEDNRMKKVEEEARERAIDKIVKGASVKKAQLGTFLENLYPARDVAALALLLGTLALTKKRLDAQNVDSSKLTSISPSKVVFKTKKPEAPAEG